MVNKNPNEAANLPHPDDLSSVQSTHVHRL